MDTFVTNPIYKNIQIICLTGLFTAVLSLSLTFSQSKQTEQESKTPKTATGIVFHDQDGDGKKDDDESGISGVRVSNGAQVTQTDENGRYELPVDDHTILFVCKPRGWIYPTNKNNLPQFYYIHKPDGSPDENYKYKGSEPTGPLPDSVNFPVYEYDDQNSFKAILFGDTQPSNRKQVHYFGRDIMTELVGVEASFGVTLGDIVGNNLSLFKPMKELHGLAGIPWHYVIGNHDINFQSKTDQYANETFHRSYGPSDYAFQYGKVHFLALDNVVYHGQKKRGYHAEIKDRQLTFIKNYLKTVPKSHRIVIGTHIPLVFGLRKKNKVTKQTQDVLDILSEFSHTASFSAHTHINAVYHLDSDDGYHPENTHGVHIHHNLGTTSGTWWKGPLDSRGIPMTTMRDGTPNGYAIVSFEGTDMRVKWKPAHHEPDYQMNIDVADRLQEKQLGTDEAEVVVNVFNGSKRSEVKMRVQGQTEWIRMEQEFRKDPFYVRQHKRDHETPMKGTHRLNPPRKSTHIWVGNIPEGVETGTHLIEVKATDAYGHEFRDRRPIRVR